MKKIFLALLLSFLSGAGFAQSINLPTPAGSVAFGTSITVLPNGNYVVTDPKWSNGSLPNVGAVYLYDGQTNALISTLTGSQANDKIGIGGITALSNGNYVVVSPYWKDGFIGDAGAVTWCNGNTGVNSAVSASNSLVGSQASDNVGFGEITTLSNGNYVVGSPFWANGSNSYAGAATWCNGSTGITGTVSAANSLVGTQPYDQVGNNITALSNGNYVVGSPNWRNGFFASAGAATWCNGSTGTMGAVNTTNSLVGSHSDDKVGSSITALGNGNYVVTSRYWRNGSFENAGAVTWGNGSMGTTGTVSAANSLVGTQFNDYVGIGGIAMLSNGNYVVGSPNWRNGSFTNAGAATWGNGSMGITGTVSASNSLVGTQIDDQVGISITALSNGNYVVGSAIWDNGSITNAGAATWGNGNTGVNGTINASNSLVGTQTGDRVSLGGITALNNGNYVVESANWNNGSIANAGAATWGNGNAGVNGTISASNSLVGTQAHDQVGNNITALSNGNYVVGSPFWANGSNSYAGAATWGSGSTGTTGTISVSNSLVGTQTGDNVGNKIAALSNGNYVAGSYFWKNGNHSLAGAATWGNGSTGTTGTVSASNSLVGTQTGDRVGGSITALGNGNYVLGNLEWSNGSISSTGAITLGNAQLTGFITSCNSVVGNIQGGGLTTVFAYNISYNKLIVGKSAENVVSVFSPSQSALATANTAISNITAGFNPVDFVDVSCKLVCSLTPADNAPVSGDITAKVYLLSGTPTTAGDTTYLRRTYDISPATDADTATAKITLYFTQAEFDDYNAVSNSLFKLPASPTDTEGKKALSVIQQRGTSTTGNFGTFTGFAGSGPANVLVIPGDSNVFWNAPLLRWEVTFPVTGFGGFFLSAGNNNPLSLPAEMLSNKGIAVSPVPATNTLTITNHNTALSGSTVTALNLQGQVMATTTLQTSTQLEIQSWPAGIYLLKFANGSVMKVVKQ